MAPDPSKFFGSAPVGTAPSIPLMMPPKRGLNLRPVKGLKRNRSRTRKSRFDSNAVSNVGEYFPECTTKSSTSFRVNGAFPAQLDWMGSQTEKNPNPNPISLMHFIKVKCDFLIVPSDSFKVHEDSFVNSVYFSVHVSTRL